MASEFYNLASGLVTTEFDYITGSDLDVELQNASGWFSANLGTLNNRIFTSFSGEAPNLGLEEQSIYKHLYLSNYYAKKASETLRNTTSDALDWIALREGDTSIRRTNRNEVAKSYRGVSRENSEACEKLINSYILYQADPREVHVYNSATGVV